MKSVGLLLAAGHSRRFGTSNKLLSPYRRIPLVTHASTSLRACGLDHLVAVVRDDAVAALLDGFALVAMSPDAPQQADSLRAGIRTCLDCKPDRILIVLGDMPLVTRDHLLAVAARCSDSVASASTDGKSRMPPACFPASVAEALLSLEGDAGAAPILKALPEEALVQAPPGSLKDVDTMNDLI